MNREARQFSTLGIILSRTDYGEADRILTFITPDHGKIRAIAKGVRKAGAKLAGAIELFSVSELTFVAGRGEAHTITSARLKKHYGHIVKELERTNSAYEAIKILNKSTQDRTEEEYFTLLHKTLEALNDSTISPEVADVWFRMQLLKLSGHAPELKTDDTGSALQESATYDFDVNKMRFTKSPKGEFDAKQIKFLRLGFAAQGPSVLQRVEAALALSAATRPFVELVLAHYVRV
jgi:DNA repair protein RecO (recombination protein O)